MSEPVIILCETPGGCTCGAPASTPPGMHHCDCAVHPGWCGQPSCLPCERNGRVISRVQAIEAAEDHTDQVVFDAWRERGQ